MNKAPRQKAARKAKQKNLLSSAHVRIADACRELEAALADFENDDEAQRRARAEADKLAALRRNLEKLRRQIDDLSV